MERIKLWAIVATDEGSSVEAAAELANTETEELLEDLLVASPALLMPGLTLVGRQLPTAGGPLDLLGVDQDGQLVLFELKRGSLTRDAVAQILDYGSDLAEKDPADLARLIEKNSGSNGIADFEDFDDWLQAEFPDAPDLLEKAPRMVLVGLGVDDRARRIVSFLADSDIDIQLLTFQAFELDGRLVLARTSATVDPQARKAAVAANSKSENLRALTSLARDAGVEGLLNELADFVEAALPGEAYRWPGKTTIGFSLPERTAEGKPTLRTYVVLHVQAKHPKKVMISVNQRGLDAAPAAVERFLEDVEGARLSGSSWTPLELYVEENSWEDHKGHLRELLISLVEAWRSKLASDGEATGAETRQAEDTADEERA